MAQLKITQVKSKIRCLEKHKRTLVALGLRHPHDTVIHNDTPQIRGMIALVDYLVRVEPHEGSGASKGGR
jgi:large subunit ribosomal protein L30